MSEIAAKKLPFTRLEVSREEALEMLRKREQKYKVERLADIPEGEKITFYQCGDFIDLCRGPHVDDSSQIGAFKLTSIAGSYYRGKETNPMLQRVYGTAFHDKKELNAYLTQIEEAKKRDHRRLGKDLDLFSMSETVGPGLVLWHPRGGLIRNLIETYWRAEHIKNGYELLYTPHIGRANLWETSGHLDFYKGSMYSPMEIDKADYYREAMKLSFPHRNIQEQVRSYRELPLRWAELGTVYRYEKSGVLHGLLRGRLQLRTMHTLICTPEQIEARSRKCLISASILEDIRFKEIKAYLSTRPKNVGEQSRWEQLRNRWSTRSRKRSRI
jgi:threonyl-tRNA synthetase